jgi:sugar/nucleoside kinase (ribokinase family)
MENKILIVGTAAYDSIETPFGKREKVLGGSGVHASLSSTFFAKPILFSTVGEDFDPFYEDLLAKSGVEVKHIKKLKGEKTFYWSGSYIKDLNSAETLKTELNVLEKFETEIPEELREIPYLFLANIDPQLQLKIVLQMKNLRFCGLDTMNFWINSKKEEIYSLFPRISIMFLNDAEVKSLSCKNNIFEAAEELLSSGLRNLVVKRGEYGSVLFSQERMFICPAFPLKKVVDPTGAGDTFAGAFMGYIAQTGSFEFENLKVALLWGTVASSFCVSDFSVSAITSTTFENLNKRKDEFKAFLL